MRSCLYFENVPFNHANLMVSRRNCRPTKRSEMIDMKHKGKKTYQVEIKDCQEYMKRKEIIHML